MLLLLYLANLKLGAIILAFKKQGLDPEEVSNYRPNFNLPLLGNLHEHAVAAQLREHSLYQPVQRISFWGLDKPYFVQSPIRVTNGLLVAISIVSCCRSANATKSEVVLDCSPNHS